MTGNGKIARLPREIRDQLNRRLDNGEPAIRLAEWLNSLPEVRSLLAEQFGGRPVSKQNLSEWKKRGYPEWQARQEVLAQARELAADAGELTEATDGRLTDHLATVLGARYATALAGWNGEVSGKFSRKLRTLRGLCQDIVELRRGDHSVARLNMERERLEREREKTEEEVLKHFQRWVKNSEVREWIADNKLSEAEKWRRIREIFGLPPEKMVETQEKPETPPEADGQSSGAQLKPVKPDQTESNQIKPNERTNRE